VSADAQQVAVADVAVPEPGSRVSFSRALGAATVLLGLVAFYFLMRQSGSTVALVIWFLEHASYLLGGTAVALAVLSWREWRGRRVTLAPLAVLIALGLSIAPALASWLGPYAAYSKIGGVLPWSDASEYHIGGIQLLETGRLSSFNMRRPLNAGFYATRLFLTMDNFWAVLLIQALLLGGAGFWVCRTIARRFGLAAGVASGAVLYTYALACIDVTLSEALGLTMGCLAFVALWQAVERTSLWLFAVGLVTLTVALNIRSGAFLVLPLLIGWIGWDAHRRGSNAWRPAALAVVAVAVGFLLCMPMNAMFGTGGGSAQGNFADILYGIAHGGVGWQAAAHDFAGRHFASDADLAHAIYRAAFTQIIHHPQTFARGLWVGYRSYLGRTYGFAPHVMNFVFSVAMLVGWVGLLQRPHRRLGSMLLAAWLGILLSVPFIFQDGGHRVMAPIVPFLAAPVGLGAAVLARRGFTGLKAVAERSESQRSVTLTAFACGCALLLLVAGAPLSVWLHTAPRVSAPVCGTGEIPMVLEAGPQAAHLTVVPSGAPTHGFGQLTDEQLHAGVSASGVEIARAFTDIPTGSVVLSTYNLLSATDPNARPYAIAVVPSAAYPAHRELVAICGRPSPDPAAAPYGLVFTDTMKRVG
jgi:hypothetical protein